MLIPALEYLKKECPDLKLSVLALRKGISLIAERLDFIEEAIELKAEGVSLKEKVASILSLAKKKFDCSFSFFPTNRREYNLLPFLAGIRKRFNFKYDRYFFKTLSFLNTERIKAEKNLHDLEQNFILLEKILSLSHCRDQSMPVIPIEDAEQNWAKEEVKRLNPENKKIIGIHPGSSAENDMDAKRWMVEYFAELTRMISKEKDVIFFVFGGPEENKLKEELVELAGEKVLPIITKTFFQAAGIIADGDMFISNDSGLMHVATSFRVPTAALFGPTDHIRTAPYGDINLVVRHTEKCSPCWTISNVGVREKCAYGNFPCINNLSPAYAFDKIKSMIEKL